MRALRWMPLVLLLGCETSAPTDAGVDGSADTFVLSDVIAEDARMPAPYEGPDDWCPGRPHCMNTTGDGFLYVGVAKESITPTLTETEWTDTNGNHLYDDGEPFVDLNRNNLFDAIWIAGFSSARPATGVHDPLEARAIAFRHNDVLVAHVVLDVVGLFRDDMERIRQHPELRGLGIDHLLVSSTHVHESFDTVGQWGRSLGETGINPAVQSMMIDRAARAVRRAVETARRATMRVTQTLTVDAMGDTRAYVNDTRDPVVFDPTLTVVHFAEEANPTRTIGTWINWAAHPEYSGSRNNLLTADYVYQLRRVVEEGDSAAGFAGIGGIAVFVNGAVGGQVGPGGTAPLGANGMPITEGGLPKAEAAGRAVGQLALRALQDPSVREVSGALAVSYRTARIYARVDNTVYHLAYRLGLFSRELSFFDRRRLPSAMNVPWVESRVTYLQVGPVATITAPGELHPELWVGTDDPRWSFGQRRVTETANPPDFMRAPPPPYLRELLLANPGVRYAFVSGLTEDFLGYIVAPWNYVLHPMRPYLEEAEGDHYEETNSLGPFCAEHLHQPMMRLTQWRAP